MQDTVLRRVNDNLVFVVDDEPMIAESIGAILAAEGYDVRVFYDPRPALAEFSGGEVRPWLLLTDFVMGGMNGGELLGACRRLDPGLKVILCSGNVGSEVLSNLAILPDVFVPKPFSAIRILGEVSRLKAARGTTGA